MSALSNVLVAVVTVAIGAGVAIVIGGWPWKSGQSKPQPSSNGGGGGGGDGGRDGGRDGGGGQQRNRTDEILTEPHRAATAIGGSGGNAKGVTIIFNCFCFFCPQNVSPIALVFCMLFFICFIFICLKLFAFKA